MSSYSLNDFLLFSSDVYLRLIDSYVYHYSPIAIAANIILLLLLAGLTQPNSPRLMFLFIAPLWVWLGWRFYILEYASINWFAYVAGLLCLIQAPVFIALSVRMRHRQYRIDFSIIIMTVAYIVLIRPLILWPANGELQLTEIGLLPLPTTLLTLGMVLAMKMRHRWLLLVIPMFLLITETITLFLLGDQQWQEIPVMIALLVMVSASAKYRERNTVGV